jgi:hypothetical protein
MEISSLKTAMRQETKRSSGITKRELIKVYLTRSMSLSRKSSEKTHVSFTNFHKNVLII